MQKITTFLWFDGQAEEAAKFYVSLFPRAKILATQRWGEGAPAPAGTAMSVRFRLAGRDFIALNGGPHFKFTPAISLFVDCADQKEVDRLWKRLTRGGQEQPCGWLTDKYGLSWQIIPRRLGKLLHGKDKDKDKAARVMKAMLGMTKLDIKRLERAAAGT